MKRIPRRRKLVKDAEAEITKVLNGALVAQRKAVTQRIDKVVSKAEEAPKLVIPAAVFAFTQKEKARIFRIFEKVYLDGAQRATKQVAEVLVGTDYSVKAFRDKAADWAAKNGAKLLKGVSDTTRDFVNRAVARGIDEGFSVSEIADTLKGGYAFSEDRAYVIANTETARADVEGNLEAYREAKVEMKRWLLGAGACELCQTNAAQGAIPMDEAFSSGDMAPPAHPNCRCDILPVLE